MVNESFHILVYSSFLYINILHGKIRNVKSNICKECTISNLMIFNGYI